MKEYYLAEDGTVHSRESSSSPRTSRSISATNCSAQNPADSYEINIKRKICFWLFSITIAIIAGAITSSFCRSLDLGDRAIIEFFERLLPFGIIAGGLFGSIFYGWNEAEKESYNLKAYMLSLLSTMAGIVAVGLSICIIPFILIGLWYLFLIILIIAILMALVSGGD